MGSLIEDVLIIVKGWTGPLCTHNLYTLSREDPTTVKLNWFGCWYYHLRGYAGKAHLKSRGFAKRIRGWLNMPWILTTMWILKKILDCNSRSFSEDIALGQILSLFIHLFIQQAFIASEPNTVCSTVISMVSKTDKILILKL